MRSYQKKKACCTVCGEPFLYDFRPDRGERKFCGRSCAAKWHVKNGTYDSCLTHDKKKTGSWVPCTICQTLVYQPPRLNINDKRVCSRECLKKFHSQNSTGPNNPMFGKHLTAEQKSTQLSTLRENHGVTNAFMLARHRTVSKAQKHICDVLSSSFPQGEFATERLFKSGSYKYHIDVLSEPLKTVIEFNGDFWHCNPLFYSGSFFHPKKKMTAEEIWRADSERMNALQNAGYHTIVVWENDYRANMSGTLQTLIDDVNKRCLSGG